MQLHDAIIEIENANGAEIRDLTLTRPEGTKETRHEGIIAIKCRDLVIENVRVIDNRSPAGAITLRDSKHCRISRCLVMPICMKKIKTMTVLAVIHA